MSGTLFESVVILDSGKTGTLHKSLIYAFESVVILDSGKTASFSCSPWRRFESVVILDSGKTVSYHPALVYPIVLLLLGPLIVPAF